MARPWNPNLDILETAAEALAPVLDRLVFVGGCAAGLLMTGPAARALRATDDVDAVVQATAWIEYERFNRKLRELGLKEDSTTGAPICRWKGPGFTLDVMPTSPDVLGFGSGWYPLIHASAEPYKLPSGRKINLVSVPGFLATKLAAFTGRGSGDYMASHDMEDMIAVLDGRATVVEEVRAADKSLGQHVAVEFERLLADARFREAMPGHLPADPSSQDRVPMVIERMESIARLA
jgi:predicted nucleotidyltransferase